MLKILVFDDRQVSRLNICDGLNNAFSDKIDITLCRDIFEANAAIENNQFDVIIVDCQMSIVGLSEDQAKHAQGGLLTGPAWLCSVYKEGKLLENTLIYVYTGFSTTCINAINELNEYANSKTFFTDSVKIVSKGLDNFDIIIQGIRKKLAE